MIISKKDLLQVLIVAIVGLAILLLFYYWFYERNVYSLEDKQRIIAQFYEQANDPVVVVETFMWGLVHEDSQILALTARAPENFLTNMDGIYSWDIEKVEDIKYEEGKAKVTIRTRSRVGLFFEQRNQKFKKIIPAGISVFSLVKDDLDYWKVDEVGKP